MKYFIFLISLVPSLIFITCKGQNGQNNIPSTKYNVHREYDKDGNLIQYDSTAVSTWQYGDIINQDSISNNLGNNLEIPFSNNDTINIPDSSFYGFNMPDQESNMIFPDFDEIFKNGPFDNKEITRQIQEMQKRMDEMMHQNMKQFKEYHDHQYFFKIPQQEEPDSIAPHEKPKQLKNSENENITNI
jgi:hypothetical protein